jgi:hypothetical protein
VEQAARSRDDRPGFAHAIDVAYPAEQSTAHGPATMWMRTPALLDGEEPSPFQRLCPIADCGNGISRNAGLREMSFVNADLTVVCCRDPQSDWLASTATSFWEPTGVGLSTATIFDESGPVAMALQTLVLSRPR